MQLEKRGCHYMNINKCSSLHLSQGGLYTAMVYAKAKFFWTGQLSFMVQVGVELHITEWGLKRFHILTIRPAQRLLHTRYCTTHLHHKRNSVVYSAQCNFKINFQSSGCLTRDIHRFPFTLILNKTENPFNQNLKPKVFFFYFTFLPKRVR